MHKLLERVILFRRSSEAGGFKGLALAQSKAAKRAKAAGTGAGGDVLLRWWAARGAAAKLALSKANITLSIGWCDHTKRLSVTDTIVRDEQKKAP